MIFIYQNCYQLLIGRCAHINNNVLPNFFFRDLQHNKIMSLSYELLSNTKDLEHL